MIQKIKDFIFKKKPEAGFTSMYYATPATVYAALDHYCAVCNRGFKTKAACSAHKAIKHKTSA